MCACSTMYGNVIGPFAPGNSIYNRFAQNKETVTPRSGTQRVNYDKIKPYRPVVDSRGVPKRAHVPAPEKPVGYNLFGQPTRKEDSASGQQFKPTPKTSDGILPPTDKPTDEFFSADEGPEEDDMVDSTTKTMESAGSGLGKTVRSFISGLGNIGSRIAPLLFEDEELVKEEVEGPLKAPLNVSDDLIGNVPSMDRRRLSVPQKAPSKAQQYLTNLSKNTMVDVVKPEDTGVAFTPKSIPLGVPGVAPFMRKNKPVMGERKVIRHSMPGFNDPPSAGTRLKKGKGKGSALPLKI
jgi:hypothetical protein